MSDNWGRAFGAIAALAVLWIVVYWWWEPRPRISADSGSGASLVGPSSARAETPVVPVTKPFVPMSQVPGAAQPPTAPPLVREVGQRPTVTVAVVAPQFRDYMVKQGDTLESIAARELGSRARVEALRAANPLMDPTRMRAGRTIKIPLDPENISGKPVAADPRTPLADAPVKPVDTGEEYTVKEGESLSAISKAKYGTTKYADLIYEANKDRLSSPDSVREGQKLRIPPKPN